MTDESAFVELFHEHYNAVRRFVERRVSNRESAADLTMECFEIAWRKRTPGEAFGLPWLYRTARNLIANEYRRRDREQALWSQMEEVLRVQGGEDREASDRLVAAVRSLPEGDREVLWLTYWEDLSAADCAIVLGISAGAVWTRLNRARQKLRPLLTDPQQAAERSSR